MHDHQNASNTIIEQRRTLFRETVDRIWSGVFGGETPPKLSVTVLEAVLVGVGRNISEVATIEPAELQTRYKRLLAHPEFSETALKEGLSKKPRVIARLNTAVRIFGGVTE